MRLAVAAVVAWTCHVAHAEPQELTPLAPPGLTPVTAPAAAPGPAPIESYRAWTIGADVLALTTLLIGVNGDHEDTLLQISAATYLGGAPLVHVVHGRNGHALASATMRVGLPLLGALVGDKLHATPKCNFERDGECYDEGPHVEVVVGVIAGFLAATIVDSAYLAKGDPPRTEPAPTWAPSARATHTGFTLGVTASF